VGFEAIARWSARRGRAPLEPELLAVVRARLLDYVANVAGGSDRRAVRTLADHAGSPYAALPLGAAAHVLECDDTHQASSSHPGAVIFTATLPLAARRGLGVDAVARAAVVGYEVMCRLGMASGPRNEYARGFHPTGTCGVFGAAAAAGVLLELGEDELLHALGIAGSLSSGSMAFLTNGAWTKILHPGNAARNGIDAAELAARGYRGPVDPLSRPHGYFAGHAPDGADAAIAAPSSGEPLAIERTSVKAHGCCRYEQGPIDALLELRERVDVAEVARVEVAVLEAGFGLIAEPIEAKRAPASTVDAQFSMPFGAALALVRGRATPFDHDDASLRDPELLRVAQLVYCRTDEELEAQFPAKWPAIADVELRDGSRHRASVEFPKGDPENPHTLDELVERVGVLAPWAPDAAVAALVEPLRDGDLDLPAAALLDSLAACLCV
jgi:2-methylcitrate dehydratase PrpD